MRTAVVAAIVLALAATGAPRVLAPWAMGQAPPAEPRPVPSRRTALTIPFRIAATANPHDRAVEVQLLVSANRGLQWQHAGSARPEAGKIAFNAPGDGEYWFCVKTKDAAGRIRPPGPPLAELRVLVDTTRPQLRLNTWRGVDGDVTARWDATDANLNPQSFKVQYRRSGTSEPWQPLSVTPPLADARGSYADTITWKSATPVEVQVEIADAAGNVEIHTVETGATPSTPVTGIGTAPAGARPAQQAAPGAQPTAAAPGVAAAPAGASSQGPATPRAPLDLPWQTEPAKSTPWPPEGAQTPAKPRSWDLGAASPSDSPAGSSAGTGSATGAASVDPFAARKEPSAPWAGSSASPWPAVGANASPFPSRIDAASTPLGSGGSPASSAAASGQPGRGSVSNPFAPAATGAAPGTASAARAVRPAWLINSRLMEVSYDLGTVSPTDVRAVELWGTTDGGQNWRKVASDDDHRSPVAVKIDADGVYGFRLLVHRQNGPLELPPATGQAPEMLIEVDQTEPKCHLTRVDQMAGPRSGDLVISWQASDRNFAERPVTLRWSHSPSGPWRTIAAGLENTGSYTWQMPESLPDEVFLRLEVRDAAENVGQFTTDKPISPQLPKPSGRLRGAQPVNAGRVTDRRAEPRMYFFR